MEKVTSKQEMGKEAKETLMGLHRSLKEAEDTVFMLQTSFIYHSTTHILECRKKLQDLMHTLPLLATKAGDLAGGDARLAAFQSMPGHLQAIGEGIERITQLHEKRIAEGVLFSPRAVEESTFLLQRIMELLATSADMVLAPNEIIASYVRESADEVSRKALEFATTHEERLVEGLCQPVAAPLYLGMLDSVRSVAWRIKQMVSGIA